MDVIEYSELLNDPVLVTVEEIEDQTQQMFNEIKENNQTFGRTDEQLMKNVSSGVILEKGVEKALDGTINRQVHDPRNPTTFMYDVEADGNFFEVKPSPKGDAWFNFNLRNKENANVIELKRADLTTFLKHNNSIDFVIVGYYTPQENGYLVNFKWIMNSKGFERFVKKSRNVGTGTSHYYDIIRAINSGECLSLN